MENPISKKDDLENLVNQFAPIVYFNENEKYFPTTAEKFVSSCYEVEGNGLSLKNRDPETTVGDLENAKVYVNVKIYPEESYVDIQYWFLYAFNGPGTVFIEPKIGPSIERVIEPCGQHEGDWEHITVRISLDDKQLQQVYLSQHDGGQWIPRKASYWGQEHDLFPDRPVFYSSKFGHAAYISQSKNFTHTKDMTLFEFRLVNDTEQPDKSLDSKGRCEIIGIQLNNEDILDLYDFAKPDWMKYTGNWGKVLTQRPSEEILNIHVLGTKLSIKKVMQDAGMYEQCEQECGPIPPWGKYSWDNTDE